MVEYEIMIDRRNKRFTFLYSSREGGQLRGFNSQLYPEDFELRNKKYVIISNRAVHSLVLQNDMGAEIARWDCVNGWNN